MGKFLLSHQAEIAKWETSLVGQFLQNPLSFLMIRRFVGGLWALFGPVGFSQLLVEEYCNSTYLSSVARWSICKKFREASFLVALCCFFLI